MVNINIPTDRVLTLKRQGMNTTEIKDTLERENYTLQQIADALTQANLKSSVGIMGPPRPALNIPYPPVQGYQESEPLALQDITSGMPEAPSPPSAPKIKKVPPIPKTINIETNRENIDKIEEIAESIIQEKWEDLIKSIGDITIWKERVNTDVLSVKQEIIRTQQRFENLEKAILGKISKYDENVRDLGSEMRALEKVMERILTPLTTSIKELSKITQDLKKTRK